MDGIDMVMFATRLDQVNVDLISFFDRRGRHAFDAEKAFTVP